VTAAFIVAEYNPFHNGHAYHLKKTAGDLQPDAIVCIMSGHFTQRGSASVSDKWSRARMALRAGADLVVELHPAYACSSAEFFARGALLTASGFNTGGWLSFGAECADLALMTNIAGILNDESAFFKKILAESLKQGMSFAAARERALTDCYSVQHAGASGGKPGARGVAAILKAPNNILAIEYIRAIKSLDLPFTPYAVPRATTRDCGMPEPFEYKTDMARPKALYLGASEIRSRLRGGWGSEFYDGMSAEYEDANIDGGISGYIASLPDYARALLKSEFSLGRGPVFDEEFYPRLDTIIKRGGADMLLSYADVGEGLENRIYDSVTKARYYEELVDGVATKRYPKSRVRRILTRVLLGYCAAELEGAGLEGGPPYLRVLGFTDSGRRLLSRIKPALPVITNYKQLSRAGERAKIFMDLEARATDIYASVFQNPCFRTAGQDYIRGPAQI